MSSASAADLIVAGAGVVGSALALAAAKSKRRVILAAPPSRTEDRRYFALSANACRFLASLDCAPANATPVMQMRLFIVASGKSTTIDAADCARGELCRIAAAADLGALLEKRLAEEEGREGNIRRVFSSVRELSADRKNQAAVIFANGEAAAAPLVIAADGADSPLAKMAGLNAVPKPYPQLALTAMLRFARPHFRAAYQWFDRGDTLALLPVGDDRKNTAALIWSLPAARARRLQDASQKKSFLAKIDNYAEKHLGKAALAEGAAIRSFPLFLLRRARITAERFAVIGDGAHVIHPLAGQGLNLGLSDAKTLSDAFAKTAPADWQTPLIQYRRRRPPVAMMQALGDFLQSPRSLAPLGCAFSLIRRIPPLQKIAAAAANAT